ncbi:hypothetical protein WN51_13161 [Melipona quadrifasciata]|uniref:Uncharacterized protein n=1 Tax=Melipona quadrifasciata TaxID=166423 RepID=A0A0M9A1X6_9HYME|nr:hypothetical protein WN51_13161 [Melipona quadrifasciata]
MNKRTVVGKRRAQKPAIKSRRTCWLFKASTPTPGTTEMKPARKKSVLYEDAPDLTTP